MASSFTLLFSLFSLFSLNCVHCGVEDNIYTEQSKNQWFKDGVELTRKNFQLSPNTNPAKNTILFIGDGMGISTTTAARIFDGQNKGRPGEENVLSWEEFPYTALSKTYNTDYQTSDSAGTATAVATGVKTRKGVLGVNENAVYGSCNSSFGNEVLSILTYAELEGLSTGLVTNTPVSHATPAAFYSHTPNRGWQNDYSSKGACKDIARQLIEYPYGDGLEVVMGGGRRNFLPCEGLDPQNGILKKTKCRKDGRNLTDEWLKEYNNSAYVWNKDQLAKIDPNKVDHLLGLFASNGMSYDIKKQERNKTAEPGLVEMVDKAIKILSKNPKGFFLMVEGGEIDWGHHAGKAHLALSETVVLNKAVKRAKEMTKSDETLIIVTADHSHSFVLYGYAKRGNPIFGFQKDLPPDGKPALTLSYANGPGGLKVNQSRKDLTGVNYNDTDFVQQALIKKYSENHAGEDVGIYATGPFAHLFHGVVEQNYIFHVMDHALCLTESKQEFCTKPQSRGGPGLTSANEKISHSFHLILASLVFVKCII